MHKVVAARHSWVLRCVVLMAVISLVVFVVLLWPSLRMRYYRNQLLSHDIGIVQGSIANLARMQCKAAFTDVVQVYRRRYDEFARSEGGAIAFAYYAGSIGPKALPDVLLLVVSDDPQLRLIGAEGLYGIAREYELDIEVEKLSPILSDSRPEVRRLAVEVLHNVRNEQLRKATKYIENLKKDVDAIVNDSAHRLAGRM